ncbi:MAG: Ldh family oxidoreductase, partial [Clostridia bacterium]|nr:Ldh family oxidoreductase [Clostridia bacterium]
YARIGKDAPKGALVNLEGNEYVGTSDEALKAMARGEAALATLGGPGEEGCGYKGYGFAMFVELMSAVLQNGHYGKYLTGKDEDGNKRPFGLGHFFIAIDTEHFLGEEACRKYAGDIIREVRGAKKAPGADRIYSAGEKEYEVRLAREAGVPINESVQKEFETVRNELGLNYTFPWED